MRLAKRHHGTRLEINMTPMIDVTFLLLIFFMTVNQVSRSQRERVELPRLEGSQDQTPQSLIVNIDEAGAIKVAARPLTLPQFVGLVGAELTKLDGDPSRLAVTLRADRRGNCRTVNEIMTALVRLDVTRVRVAVENAP
jgi:biopolymer transport protein ExbD